MKAILTFFKFVPLLFLLIYLACSTGGGGRYSTRPSNNAMLDLKMAGFQIDSGKFIYSFGGDFRKPASRFTVIDVTNTDNPQIVIDIVKPVPTGIQFFTAPVSVENSKWVRTGGVTRMDFDVVVTDTSGNKSVLQQGTSYSEASKRTLSMILDSTK